MLSIINQSVTDFFLTGGTALSRVYYNHRYSDDLDFFVNNSNTFDEQFDLIAHNLKDSGFFWSNENDFIRNNSFVSLYAEHKNHDAKLKLDFVNDKVPHFGEIQIFPLFGRVDPVRNIISNKLSAIFRFAAKDIADIREIVLHEQFPWKEILSEAAAKDGGLDLPVISEIMETMPECKLDEVVWTPQRKPDYKTFMQDIQKVITILAC